MTTHTATIFAIISLCALSGGCIHHLDEMLVEEALQERDAAQVRLAKAITHYCSVTTETINSRDACIVDRHLASLENNQVVPALKILRTPRSSAIQ
jgi:hypothetical protein